MAWVSGWLLGFLYTEGLPPPEKVRLPPAAPQATSWQTHWPWWWIEIIFISSRLFLNVFSLFSPPQILPLFFVSSNNNNSYCLWSLCFHSWHHAKNATDYIKFSLHSHLGVQPYFTYKGKCQPAQGHTARDWQPWPWSESSQPHSICFYSLSSSFLSNLFLFFFHHLVVLSLPALHLSWNEINHLEFQQQEPRAQTYRVFQTHMHETHATPDSVWVSASGTKGGGLCPRDIWGHRSETRAFLVAQTVKYPLAMQELQETWVPSLCRGDPLEEGMATHSSILAWKIPRAVEFGGLQSMGSQRDRQDGNHWVCTHASETSQKPMVRNLEALTGSCLILLSFGNHRSNCSSCPRSPLPAH